MAQLSGTPVLILKEGTSRTRGRSAQSNNIMAGIIIADAVRSTLGPRGMDKMLVDSLGDVTITNDGASILKEIDVQHPAAKMLVEVAKSQDQETGDGTTTSVVIAGELLKRSQELLEKKIHPTIVVSGYQKAAEESSKILDAIAVTMEGRDKSVLKKIAGTSMNSKSVVGSKDHFSQIAVAPSGEQLFLTNAAGKQLSVIQISQVYDIPVGTSPVIGKEGAPVTVYAFLDYQ